MKKRLQAPLVCFIFLFQCSLLSAQQHATGLEFDDAAYSAVPLSAPLKRSDYSDLPRRVSLYDYCPTPGDQGQTGTCVAWSMAFHARTILESIELHRTNKSVTDQNTFSPSYIYNQIRQDNTCENGTVLTDGLDLMVKEGVAKFNNFGFSCYKTVPSDVRQQAAQYRIYDYKRLHSTSSTNKIIPVKKSLSEMKPVVFGMLVPNSFFSAKGVWEPGELEYNNPHAGGHALCAVGYDDDKYGGAFLIINSWGTSWGNDGFIWIRYKDFNTFVKYSYEMIGMPPKTTPLSGKLSFFLDDHSPMPVTYQAQQGIYHMDTAYTSGQEFQFTLTNNEPAYVYAFGYDKTQEVFRLFPFNDTISPYLGYKQNNVVFPDEAHYVRFDQTDGADVFCFLYSTHKIDFDDFVTRFRRTSGSAYHRLKQVLGDDLLDPQNISYSQNQVVFKGDSHDTGILPVVIEITHKPAP